MHNIVMHGIVNYGKRFTLLSPAHDDLVQLRKGVTEFCLLALIDRAPRHGYELVARLAGTRTLALSESTVYPALARLRARGRVRIRVEPSERGPPRKVFVLTPAGERRLAEWRDCWEQMHQDLVELRKG